MSESDERVNDSWKISQRINIVKMVDDKGLEGEVKKHNYHAFAVGCFCIIK